MSKEELIKVINKYVGYAEPKIYEAIDDYTSSIIPKEIDWRWNCPNSPTGKCDYEQENGEYDEDCCRYCGEPEERK